MQKRDPVPEARQPLQQDPLARLRGLGADELRRGPLQLRMRDVPRRAERAEQIRPADNSASGQSNAYRMSVKPYMILYPCQIIFGRKYEPAATPTTQPSTEALPA